MPQLRSVGPTAAIAAIAPGVQSQGVWAGRRQLFVRFAAEAETAVLYTPEMLGRHLERAAGSSVLHSISLTGRDPLASAALIVGAFGPPWRASLPVMLDCDGQRPDALQQVAPVLALVQVTVEVVETALVERALATLSEAARAGCEHALVLAPRDGTSDGQLLRLVEQAHRTASGTKIVVHPPGSAGHGSLDRRFGALLEQAVAIHGDTTLVIRVPPPVGTR